MEFGGFSAGTLDFLFENRMHDSRAWFEEHKEQYVTLVQTPLRALVAELEPAVRKLDPLIEAGPSGRKAISRIYRDTRFSRDKTLFRDFMWVSFLRDKKLEYELPSYYFEISQSGYAYGCGYYMPAPALMETIRGLILGGDRLFCAALEALERQDLFELCGERYKRPRYPDQPERLRSWLEMRTIWFERRSNDFKTLFSPDLTGQLISGYELLKPVYDFMCHADETRIRKEEIGNH
ncbi:MAG: DUF2461 domain-containing protein [Clostridia bacterium]|nr:DUF2461 domain-containing protein [Clostridia bacterium]